MEKLSFSRILELYPDIRSHFSQISFGEVSGLDVINFEIDSRDFSSKIRECSIVELKDLISFVKMNISVRGIDYGSLKNFIQEFRIPNGESAEFPFDTDDNLSKLKDMGVLGTIVDKFFENENEFIKKMANQTFERSSLEIIKRTDSSDLSIDDVKSEFINTAVEYINKAESFKVRKMVDLAYNFKLKANAELDKTLIDMVYPS